MASAGFGASIQFTGLPSNFQYGTYNGYASATIDGVPLQQVICDDYDHTTYVPSGPLDYSLSTLTGQSPLQGARFADPSQLASAETKYEEAAILLNGLDQTGPGTLLDLTADYQYALWILFTPTVAAPNATALTLLNDAARSMQQGGASNQAIYSELRIYTPTAAYASNQEFLQLAPSGVTFQSFAIDPPDPSAVPEPQPAIMVGIGIGAIVLSVGARSLLLRRGARVG
jgi:hypothetical protein